MASEWIPFHRDFMTGRHVGVPRGVRFVILELSMHAKARQGIVELPIGAASDLDAVHALVGGDRDEVEAALRIYGRGYNGGEPTIVIEGNDGERYIRIPGWSRRAGFGKEPPGASTQRVREHRARKHNHANSLDHETAFQSVTETDRNAPTGQDITGQDRSPPSGATREGARPEVDPSIGLGGEPDRGFALSPPTPKASKQPTKRAKEKRLANAWAEGIGGGFALTRWTGSDLLPIAESCSKTSNFTEQLAWVKALASRFARECPDAKRKGFKPQAAADWLNAGCPTTPTNGRALPGVSTLQPASPTTWEMGQDYTG